MAYSATAVANAFIEKAVKNELPKLSPMKLQKLMFFTQSWHLRLYNEPLIDDFFAKWRHGPVIPSFYHEVKSYGSGQITNMISVVMRIKNSNAIVTPKLPDTDGSLKRCLIKFVMYMAHLRDPSSPISLTCQVLHGQKLLAKEMSLAMI